MGNKGQATVLEGLLIIFLIALLGFVFWQQLNKKTQSNQFKDQAQMSEFNDTHSGIRLFDLSCVPKDLLGKSYGIHNPISNSSK